MAQIDKEVERRRLEYFLRARKWATGEELTCVRESESPDFVCQRSSGELLGIELTRMMYNPHRDEITNFSWYDEECDDFGIRWDAAVALAKKEAKRRKDHWQLPSATILVVELITRIRFGDWPTDNSFSDEFSNSGFLEVWLCDHSSLGEYDEVTAIGLFPKAIWDIRGQRHLWGLPLTR